MSKREKRTVIVTSPTTSKDRVMSKRENEPVTPLPPRRPDVFNILPVLFLCTGGILCGWASDPVMTDCVNNSSQATFCWIVAPPLVGVGLASLYTFTITKHFTHWNAIPLKYQAVTILLIVVAGIAILWAFGMFFSCAIANIE